jgi:hypothetical protein
VDPGRRLTVDITGYLKEGMTHAVVEVLAGDGMVEGHLVLGEPFQDFADFPARRG